MHAILNKSVKCPSCRHEWEFTSNDINWPKDKDEKGKTLRHHIDKAYVQCPCCPAQLSEADLARRVVIR